MIALIIDTETSGLISNHAIKLDKQPEVIEYFSVLTNLATGERLREFETLIKPNNPVDAVITEITGIENNMLTNAQPFAELAEAIKTDIESSPVVIAQNMSFDAEMLDIEFERLGMKINWPRKICTVEATLHFKGHRLKQMQLYEYLFNETFKDAHRARNDCLALERICIELFKRGEL
jgi:DNA polymerase III epsilon subunit-like protein